MNSNEVDLHAAAHEVRILAGIVTKIASRDMEQRLHASGVTITGLQHGLLRLLRDHPYTSSELSRRMKLTPATLVPAVDALERHGLVERGRDPNDRRRTPLVLTEQAVDLLGRAPVIDNDDTLLNCLARMDQAKRSELLEALRELVGMLLDDPAHVDEIGASVRQMVQEHAARREQA